MKNCPMEVEHREGGAAWAAALTYRSLPVDGREAWIEALEIVPVPLIVARRSDEPRRVLLLGDTGDGSEAQAAVAQHLVGRAEQPGSQFGCSEVTAVLIESDVVYPAGSVREQKRKFRDKVTAREKVTTVFNHEWQGHQAEHAKRQCSEFFLCHEQGNKPNECYHPTNRHQLLPMEAHKLTEVIEVLGVLEGVSKPGP